MLHCSHFDSILKSNWIRSLQCFYCYSRKCSEGCHFPLQWPRLNIWLKAYFWGIFKSVKEFGMGKIERIFLKSYLKNVLYGNQNKTMCFSFYFTILSVWKPDLRKIDNEKQKLTFQHHCHHNHDRHLYWRYNAEIPWPRVPLSWLYNRLTSWCVSYVEEVSFQNYCW